MANCPTKITSLETLLNKLICLLSDIIPLLITLATVVFLWGIIKFISASSSGDEKNLKEGRTFMLYGIIGLFVIVVMWGLTSVLLQTFFNTTITNPPPIPEGPLI